MDLLNVIQSEKISSNEHIKNEHFSTAKTITFTVNNDKTLLQLITMAKYDSETQKWSDNSTNNQIIVTFNVTTVTTIDFTGKSLGANDVISLSFSLIQFPRMTTLKLNNYAIGENGATALASSLKYLPELTTLHLGENYIGPNGAIALASSLKYLPELTTLHLGGNYIGENGAIALASSLKYLPKLTTLHLGGNYIGENGAIALADSLQYLTKLTTLHLGENYIGENGAIALANSLHFLPNLLDLYFDNNSMGEHCATALADSLQYLPKLTYLSLSSNSIGDSGAIALAASFQYSPNLTHLYLSNNYIGENGAIALAGSFQYLTNVVTIYLRDNSIGEKGAIALAGSSRDLTKLTGLHLINNNFINVSVRYYYVTRLKSQLSSIFNFFIRETVESIAFPGVDPILNNYTVDGNFLTKNGTKYIMSFTSPQTLESAPYINLSRLKDPVKMKILLYDIMSIRNFKLDVSDTYNAILDDIPIAPIYAIINITKNAISVDTIRAFCSKINKLYELKNTGYPTITYTSNGGSVMQTTNIISPVTEYKTSIVIPSYSSTSINTLFNTIQYTSSIEQNKDIIIANIQDYFKSNNIITTFYVNVNKKEGFGTVTYTVTIYFKLDTMAFVKTNASALLRHELKIEPKTEPTDSPNHKSNVWIYIILSIVIILILGLVYYKYKSFTESKLLKSQ